MAKTKEAALLRVYCKKFPGNKYVTKKHTMLRFIYYTKDDSKQLPTHARHFLHQGSLKAAAVFHNIPGELVSHPFECTIRALAIAKNRHGLPCGRGPIAPFREEL